MQNRSTSRGSPTSHSKPVPKHQPWNTSEHPGLGEGWNKMSFKIPPSPNHSGACDLLHLHFCSVYHVPRDVQHPQNPLSRTLRAHSCCTVRLLLCRWVITVLRTSEPAPALENTALTANTRSSNKSSSHPAKRLEFIQFRSSQATSCAIHSVHLINLCSLYSGDTRFAAKFQISNPVTCSFTQ